MTMPIRAPRFAGALLSISLAAIALGACDRVSRQRELESTPFARQVRDAIPNVEKATGMTFKRPPSLAVRSRREVRAFVQQQFEEAAPAREFAAREALYKRLGAVPERMDLRGVVVDLLEEQIVGYYDPKKDTLYVVEGSDAQATSIVITHELVHALQDQYVDLDSVMRLRGDDDRLTAMQSVIEGQATYDGIVAMAPGLINGTTNWDNAREEIRRGRNASPKMAAAPLLLQEVLIFPYLSGAEFVRRYRERRPGKNVLLEWPQSTEQVLHANAFFGTAVDAPLAVRFTGLRTTPEYENTIGEFETRVILYEQLREQQVAIRAALGWGGDRIALLGEGADAPMVWATVWDESVDAAEFFDAVTRAMALRYQTAAPGEAGATTRAFTARGRTVTVTAGEVGGRPAVLVVDTPAGQAAPATLANVRIEGATTAGRGNVGRE